MADKNHTDLPPGISVIADWPSRVEYVGTDDAFTAAGMLNPAWIIGLGRFTRAIVVDAVGGFVVLGEGKGNRVKRCHRVHGAWCVKRLIDGRLMVAKYRSLGDEAAIKRQKEEQRERERGTWKGVKEVRQETDFPARWRDGVLHRVQEVIAFLDGKLLFRDFPAIQIDQEAARLAKESAAVLDACIRNLSVKLDDRRVEQSNVVRLEDRAYWSMSRGGRKAGASA
jgi:hypothetical protein